MSIASNSQRCVVEIGKNPILLSCDDVAFLDTVRQRYAGFLSSATPNLRMTLEITVDGKVSDDDVQVHREGRAWLLERGDFQARWDPATGSGRIRQRRSLYALDSVLRIVHSLILAETGGFLLHAASAACADTATGAPAPPSIENAAPSAFLFSGVSGAGKTTITRLAPPEITLLTDEISYIRPNREGGYSAFGTPFAGELARPGENVSAPIAALFFLDKGPENVIEDLSAAEAVRRLMRNILFFADDRNLVENLFATACDFVHAIPIRRLTFYPDRRVWQDIRTFERVPAHA